MIIGTCGLSGGRKAMVGSRTNTKSVLFAGLCAMWLEQTPLNTPFPDLAGTRTPPAVMLHASASTSGEDEIE